MNPAFALAEVIWIMSGRNDSAFLNYFNPKLPQYAGAGEFYHGAYGFRLRKHFGFDQLEHAYHALSANPDSRQVVLQIWESQIDMPDAVGAPRSKDIPCNIVSMLKIRNGRLEWTQIMRSNDLVLGLPHNIVQFTSLQEIMAGWLNVEVGAYHHFADSLHLYENYLPVSAAIDPQELPRNNDSIAVPKDETDRAIMCLSSLGDVLSSPNTNVDSAVHAFHSLKLNPAFRNWGAILTADALRRRGARREIVEVMTECTNKCLSEMFKRWQERATNI